MSREDRHIDGLPIVMVGIVAALFIFFVYGYTRFFPLLESSHPDHFEMNVADAMSRGDFRNAARIARRATQLRPLDPMAYTVYGRVLLQRGEAEEALEQLTKAVGVRANSLEPRKSYYFAPARLTLGKYYFEQDMSVEAIANFELARAYAVPADIEYSDFHEALYGAYAKQGLWARALEFGAPSEQELEDVEDRDIVRIARVCEGRTNWDLVKRMAELLLERKVFTAEAHYLLGRAHLAQDEYEASLFHLEQAVLKDHAHSAYFLGTALEKNGLPARAIQALLRTPSGDVYRPFALAAALALFADFAEDEQAFTTVTRQGLLAQLDREIATMRSLQRPILYDKYRRFTPVGVTTSKIYSTSGGRFPILILWEDGQAPSGDVTRMSFSSSGVGDSLLLRRKTDSILQLQWVENLVHWDSVERLGSGATEVPGWIDTARDWFGLRPDYAARIQEDVAGNSFLSISKFTWFYSVPIRVRDGVGYLLSGRFKGSNSKGSIGWQSLDDSEYVLFDSSIMGQEKSKEWTWQAGYFLSQLHWDGMRVRLNVMRNAGTISFDDVMLVEINEPDPALVSAVSE